ncbi:ATP-binding protein [Methylomonas lenta]|uniref:ATP-binding protein n=1 Tax=Methylomonas lenta TaxID=980561 RepID=UPI0038B9922D
MNGVFHRVVVDGQVTGTGKTHIATALSVSGIQHHGKRVRFYLCPVGIPPLNWSMPWGWRKPLANKVAWRSV